MKKQLSRPDADDKWLAAAIVLVTVAWVAYRFMQFTRK